MEQKESIEIYLFLLRSWYTVQKLQKESIEI